MLAPPMRIRKSIRSIAHEERLTVVGHLDELRSRIIISLLVVAVAFGVCFWQNHRLLNLINKPLAHQTQQQVREGHGPLGATYQAQPPPGDFSKQLRTAVGVLGTERQAPTPRATLVRVQDYLQHDLNRLSTPP